MIGKTRWNCLVPEKKTLSILVRLNIRRHCQDIFNIQSAVHQRGDDHARLDLGLNKYFRNVPHALNEEVHRTYSENPYAVYPKNGGA